MSAQQERGRNRVTRGEQSPTVGNPSNEQLKATIPVFTEKLMDALKDYFKIPDTHEIILISKKTGKDPQELSIIFRKSEGVGQNVLSLTLTGDWEGKEKPIEGSPLIPNYDGKFYRKQDPKAKEPFAKDGDYVAADGVLGWAIIGKNQRWLFRVPKEEYPNGVQITKFAIENEAEVKKGETVICYLKKV